MTIRDTENGGLVWHCKAGCDGREVGRALHQHGLLSNSKEDGRCASPPPRQPTQAIVSDRSKLDWLLSKLLPIEGKTPVTTYLGTRGLDLPPQGHHLRYLPAKPPKFIWPRMVGIVSAFDDPERILSLHFTRLQPDGLGKAPLPKGEQRSLLAGFPIKGGVIRLCGDADITRRVALAEGIETALAVTTAFRRDEGRFEPVHAALNAGNLGSLVAVDGIETVVIYADHGTAGEAAADRLAQRWLEAKREVFVAVAPVDDWNPTAAPS